MKLSCAVHIVTTGTGAGSGSAASQAEPGSISRAFFPSPKPGDASPVVPAGECDHLIDPLAPISLEIGPGDEAAHAVRDEPQLPRAGILKISFDSVVELFRKPVDAGERRLQIDSFSSEAGCSQPGNHPPPQARIAAVAMHQHHRQLLRPPWRSLNGENRVRKWLDHGEQREKGKPLREDCSARRQKPDLLLRNGVFARPTDRKCCQRKKKIDTKQRGETKRRGHGGANLCEPNQQEGAERDAERLHRQPETKPECNHACPPSQ